MSPCGTCMGISKCCPLWADVAPRHRGHYADKVLDLSHRDHNMPSLPPWAPPTAWRGERSWGFSPSASQAPVRVAHLCAQVTHPCPLQVRLLSPPEAQAPEGALGRGRPRFADNLLCSCFAPPPNQTSNGGTENKRTRARAQAVIAGCELHVRKPARVGVGLIQLTSLQVELTEYSRCPLTFTLGPSSCRFGAAEK